MVDLQDIPGLNGADNMPGVATEIFFAPKSDFEIIQAPGADGVTISASHVFKPGKGFYKMYNSLETGELNSEMKGNIDGRYQAQKYAGHVPGIRAAVASIIRKAQNVEMIVLVKEANTKVIQLGDNTYPAYMAVGAKTGKAGADDTAGFNVEISSYGIATQFYTGDIQVKSDYDGVATLAITTAGAEAEVVSVRVYIAGTFITIGSYTIQADDTTEDIAAGLATAIEAEPLYNFSATAAGSVLTIEDQDEAGDTYEGAYVSLFTSGTTASTSTLLQRTL